MYCFIAGHEIPICNDFTCPVRPCTDKRAVDFLRESTNLTLDDAKKEHRNIRGGILNQKIVFIIPNIIVKISKSDCDFKITIQDDYDKLFERWCENMINFLESYKDGMDIKDISKYNKYNNMPEDVIPKVIKALISRELCYEQPKGHIVPVYPRIGATPLKTIPYIKHDRNT